MSSIIQQTNMGMNKHFAPKDSESRRSKSVVLTRNLPATIRRGRKSSSAAIVSTSDHSYMSIESILTRELGIRFIDARKLVTEAKAEQGMIGYTCKEDEAMLMQEAIKLFEAKPLGEQESMKRLQRTLECISTTESILSFDGDSEDLKSLDLSVDSTVSKSSSRRSSISSMTLMKAFFKPTAAKLEK